MGKQAREERVRIIQRENGISSHFKAVITAEEQATTLLFIINNHCYGV